jgi:hypothetical protein
MRSLLIMALEEKTDYFWWEFLPPNFLPQWLTFLLRILEDAGSYLNPVACYPDLSFSWFSSVPSSR